ncbi:radical SAM family heme chaperone HemW [Compostibacter hankyongensis]|uniref:Heme chaperone HemW n=1 Tax=Compostibacter hankyongensis TaxID=1007089 RepID=A0ABP8FDG7_9BACT
MAGIYIHIPFCRQACHYCNFYFSTSQQQRAAWLEALLEEIRLQGDFFTAAGQDPDPLATLYLGGGTPSLLDTAELAAIFGQLRRYFLFEHDAEITLEANPDDVDAEKLQAWKQLDIRRLSIGVQSFSGDDLRGMHRAHDSRQALQSILLAQQHGFSNLSADLIYGTPTLDDGQWRHNVEQLLGLGLPHLSCYALTVEPHTALDSMIRRKQYPPVDPGKAARQAGLLETWLEDAGYEHYEISNFAKPGHRARHNSSYWQGVPYLGLGPAAHSFNGHTRQWNIANTALYIKSIREGRIPCEQEVLTPDQQYNEYIMTALRTLEGCDLELVAGRFGAEKRKKLEKESGRFLRDGRMLQEGARLRLSPRGRLFADGIAADLFC